MLRHRTLNQIVSAWISFYELVLGWDVNTLRAQLPRQSRCKLQIRAYSKAEVKALIYDSDLGLRRETLLSTVYHAGLRAGEVCQLEVSDIQKSNGAILVRQGKGKKDRYTLLPNRLVEELRAYYRVYRPLGGWLFYSPVRGPEHPISRRGVENIFYTALKKSGLPNRGGPHCLRHSFATHHLQDGMDIVRLQKLMGHRSLATTARYLHILSEVPKLSHSPLDRIEEVD